MPWFRSKAGGAWRLRAIAVILAAIVACASGTTAPPTDHPSKRILFIGNSLTYFNDLPGMVKALARAADGEELTVESIALPGVGLEDHWHQGAVLDRLADTTWDLVILQQGPSGTPESRTLLIQYAKLFAGPIRAAGARPAVYMVWPEISRPMAFDSVADNYTAAAETIDAMLFPGIRAWQAVWAVDPTIALYSSDGLHPTPLGTYTVAVMMVHQITGRRAVGLPEAVETGAISFHTSPGIARIVQEAAEQAARGFGRR
jgi:hypothetical protein